MKLAKSNKTEEAKKIHPKEKKKEKKIHPSGKSEVSYY